MDNKEFHFNSNARALAIQRIQQARVIFTTCVGAGLGLLRNEKFQIVLIDESSQQSEPMSVIPLSKGCQRAILVGDHVQLRGTTGKYAKTMGMEVSLFERLYGTNGEATNHALTKVMLNVQYRMHPQIGEFPSREFYNGRLRAHASCQDRPLPMKGFPWPRQQQQQPLTDSPVARCIFVPCTGAEDAGYQSKGNTSQAELSKKVYQLLTATESGPSLSVAILTPYTRQVKILRSLLPGSTMVSSIDGFQGREADVIIFVTVRCNPHGNIGFLSDLRRLNVVLTRARAGLIVVGCPRTLTQDVPSSLGDQVVDGTMNKASDGEKGVKQAVDTDSIPVWKRLVASLVRVEIS
jgi:regulator of nonsense transcripts 1